MSDDHQVEPPGIPVQPGGEYTARVRFGNEADRLRGLLARLEWAGTTCYDAYGAEYTCPACRVQWDTAADFKGHADDCWLAAELH